MCKRKFKMCSKLRILLLVILAFLVKYVGGTAPSCNPNSYEINVGINSTVNTVLAVLNCNDVDNDDITYSVDETFDGHFYFSMDGNNLTLVNRIDVEYGINSWNIGIIVEDTNGESVTVLVTIATFTSTTTTTVTPPPPGYDWFDSSDNRILFWSAMALTAFITGVCVLMCLRFHRKGTCLPTRWPKFTHCIASCRRQIDCCPLPCDFHDNKPEKEKQKESLDEEQVFEDSFPGLPPPVPATSAKNTHGTSSSSKKEKTAKDDSPEKAASVTPAVIGNVNLDDVGFDGMRSPGFNAPMFTSYGGKEGRQTTKKS